MDQPANPDAMREAPRRYRQPILVWQTGFAALPLPSTVQVAPLPCEVVCRWGVGWPDPESITRRGRRFAVWNTETPQGWRALLMPMAAAGEQLPEIESHTLLTPRVGKTGTLNLIEDHTLLRPADDARRPMQWQPSEIDEVFAAPSDGTDMDTKWDLVT